MNEKEDVADLENKILENQGKKRMKVNEDEAVQKK